MTIDEQGNRVYLTPVSVRAKVLEYYRQNRDAILKRRRELKKLNSDQQKSNRERWAARNRSKLRDAQIRFAAKRRKSISLVSGGRDDVRVGV